MGVLGDGPGQGAEVVCRLQGNEGNGMELAGVDALSTAGTHGRNTLHEH